MMFHDALPVAKPAQLLNFMLNFGGLMILRLIEYILVWIELRGFATH